MKYYSKNKGLSIDSSYQLFEIKTLLYNRGGIILCILNTEMKFTSMIIGYYQKLIFGKGNIFY